MLLKLPPELEIKHKSPVNFTLRESADNTLEQLLKCALGIAYAKPEDIVKSCITCDFFSEQNEICKKYNQRPPARVIAFGCPQYSNIDDLIPF